MCAAMVASLTFLGLLLVPLVSNGELNLFVCHWFKIRKNMENIQTLITFQMIQNYYALADIDTNVRAVVKPLPEFYGVKRTEKSLRPE